MDIAVRDIPKAKIRLSSALEEQIDKYIEQSENEIANGEYMEAHEAHHLIKEELKGV